MADQKSGYSRVWGVLLLLGVGAIAWLTTPISLKYGDEIITSLPTMFGYLLLISLFVERAIEVFLSAWRSGRADELDIEIANLNKQVAGSAKTTVEKLKLNLQSLEKDRTVYRAGSRFIAQWLGLGIGVLVALVGVRVLGNIVDITTLSKAQEAAFVVVDVLLTGAVLAGGSEAINKIMKVYNSFMIKTAEKAKG